MTAIRNYLQFLFRIWCLSWEGSWQFYAWMGFLSILSLIGVNAWAEQFVNGLQTTGMTDQVSWGAYIANFTFLVGVAAAAVMLVIPAYVYKMESMHKVVLFGELMAIAVIVMCLLFVTVDLGHPERFLHLIPPFGRMNWPISMLSWDVIVLNGYLLLNLHICGYLLYMMYLGKTPTKAFYIPFVFIAIVWAISIHTVTAFLYVGLAGRPFWNHPIVAPRFLASAFAAGPALLILTFQIIRRLSGYWIGNEPLQLLRRISTIALLINVFLLGCEVFVEFYSGTYHSVSAKYLWFGVHGHDALVPWIWTALSLNLGALLILISPFSSKLWLMDIACVAMIVGIWIEKGMGLIVPGFVPTPLGQIVEYQPSSSETWICIGIWSFGLLMYSWMLHVAIPIMKGDFNIKNDPSAPNLT